MKINEVEELNEIGVSFLLRKLIKLIKGDKATVHPKPIEPPREGRFIGRGEIDPDTKKYVTTHDWVPGNTAYDKAIARKQLQSKVDTVLHKADKVIAKGRTVLKPGSNGKSPY